MSLDAQQNLETSTTFRHSFFLAYGLGVLLCVLWPLALQGLLGTLMASGSLGKPLLTEDLGYTFTGLVILAALFVKWRTRQVLTGFAAVEESQRSRVMTLEILLYAALFELSALYGLVYQGMGGPERYARSFIGLAPVMFLVFVPRLETWRKASQR
jgi:hypothetical protein